MAYGDGLILIGAYEQPDNTGEAITTVTVELNTDDATQVYWTYRSPFALQVEAFGFIVTEVDAAATTVAIIQLSRLAATAAATKVAILNMTLDAPLYAFGDGKKASATTIADAGLVSGSVIMYTGTALPYQIEPGETLQAELTTQGVTNSDLAGQMVALVRVAGFNLEATNVATLLAAR